MNLHEYQLESAKTDHVKEIGDNDLLLPLLGLAGEAGSLLTEYKKVLRDEDAYRVFKERFSEELGDVLWYLASVARRAGLGLDEIAVANLEKTQSRWPRVGAQRRATKRRFLDSDFPRGEKLPRTFTIELREETGEDGRPKCVAIYKGRRLGDFLTDNAYEDDAYRFHDVFHYSYAAVLGWSPLLRRLMKRKRKSAARVDEVEDGARAIITEEAVSAIVFEHARVHSFYDKIKTVDFELLRTVKTITSHLEVGRCSYLDWECAILSGYSVWRQVKKCRGGVVLADLRKRTLGFQRRVRR